MRAELALVEDHVRRVAARGREEIVVGPFAALFHPDPEPYLSLAVPIVSYGPEGEAAPLGPAADLAEPLAELATLFAARGRPLRAEFSGGLWPTLPAALEAAGLRPETEAPLLVGTPAGFRARHHPGAQVRWVEAAPGGAGAGDLAFLGSLMKRGFEADGKIEPEEIAALTQARAAGTRYAIAYLGALPCASGCSSPIGRVTELAALSTVPPQRGRGAGAALASFLTERHFEDGGTVTWVSAAGEACYGLFSALGFADMGLRLTYSAADPGAPRD